MPFPSDWTRALARVHAAGGADAVIAGGAVRDFLLGREIKDIDIFLQSHGFIADEKIARFAFDGIKLQLTNGSYRPAEIGEVGTLWVYDDPFGTPVQLIFLDINESVTPAIAIEHCDFGLCRVAFDGEQLHMSGHFIADLAGQTMTLRRDMTTNNVERSKRRFDRLSVKFPTYTYVNPYADQVRT